MTEATQTGAEVNEDNIQNVLKDIISKKPKQEPAAEPEPQKAKTEPAKQEPVEEPEAEPEIPQPDDEEPPEEPKEDVKDKESELTLSQFAAAFGVDENLLDVNDDGEVILKTKVDGKEGVARLNEVLKNYQLEGHLNNRNMEVAELKKSLETEKNKLAQMAQQKIGELEKALHVAAMQLNSQYQIDWNRLKAENPSEYQRLRIEYSDHQNNLSQLHQFLESNKQKALKDTIDSESRLLFDKVPEWKDQKAFEQGKTEIMENVKYWGFTPEEAAAAIDHRILLMARDAIAYRKLQDAKPETTKRVTQAPKLVKPGTVKPASSKQEALSKLKERIGKSDGALGEYLLQSGAAKIRR